MKDRNYEEKMGNHCGVAVQPAAGSERPADDGVSQDPEYVTDYYMIVQSPDGGVDIYSEADPQSSRLNEKQIVNGTAIHIQGEKTGTDNKKWGYTQYHGMNGYVPMDNLDPVDRAKAIESEFKTFGGEDVDLPGKGTDRRRKRRSL